ncbi:MAG: ATP synthase F0 subunit B [Haliscomenobacteraceae bacterium CHB4]|nr:ATP synthase subunit b [Saprospiraceae bacterium]MCE7924248.1 ATP synthase F0 subunit B [Haliscomenobacteraceae bacterium CHB4]
MLFLADFSVIKPDPGLLIWTTVIFGLFWFLMSRFAFKPIAESLKKRESDIQYSLDEAKRVREEMANLQAENEKLLQQAREERTQMLKEAKEAAEEYRAEKKALADQEYRRKVESALQDIENQKLAAMVALQNQAGQLAVEIAEKVLRKELADKSAQEAYAKNLAESIKLN